MLSRAAPLSLLKEEIGILPDLVKKTETYVPASQRRKFDAQVNEIVSHCVNEIGSNVTNFEVGRLIRMRNKIIKEIERNESSKNTSRQLVNLLSLIEEHVTQKGKKSFEARITSVVSSCIASLTKQMEGLSLKGEVGVKDDWHTLNKRVEALWRQLEVLSPDSEQAFKASLWWMSQQGQGENLDLLFKVKAKPSYSSPETMAALSTAEQGIIKREYKDIQAFFNLSPIQLRQVIEATIEKCRTVTSPHLRRAFNAKRPTHVIRWLREIKKNLEDSFEPPRIRQWLKTPLELFDEKSPREALLEGHTFPLLHLIERFHEGPHY
ncbi:MAG TPA: hypothetical protein VF708_16570 [Pyrinomonadaceae bacterium]|jgi:hypothetical protein